MADLAIKDFRAPNTATAGKLLSIIQRGMHEQATAAALANAYLVNGCPAKHAGSIRDIAVILSAAMGSGESMTVDVLVNGSSIIGGAKTINTASGTEVHYAPATAGAAIPKGAKVQVTRTYTAGGSPVAPANVVVVEWGD